MLWLLPGLALTKSKINWGELTDKYRPVLLMRPEHSETKAKIETRECETETETSLVNSIACESKTYALLVITYLKLEIRSVELGICPIAKFTMTDMFL